MEETQASLFQSIEESLSKANRYYRRRVERYMIYPIHRWAVTITGCMAYAIRVGLIGGFYVVSYILALYILHLGVQFLTPQGMPAIDDEDDEEEGGFASELPVQQMDIYQQTSQEEGGEETGNSEHEAGPLLRSMGEFRFWHKTTLAVMFSLLATLSRGFDLPVFWPFLLAYFMVLLIFTVKRQRRHMKKYNYTVLDFFRKSTK